MFAVSQSVWADVLKMVFSAAWIAFVALACQQLTAERERWRTDREWTEEARRVTEEGAILRAKLSAHLHPRLIPIAYLNGLDPERIRAVRERDAVVEVTAGPQPDVRRVADFIDMAVKSVGVDHVRVSSALNDEAGVEISLELLRRGYRHKELLKLLAGNAAQVLAAPEETCNSQSRSAK